MYLSIDTIIMNIIQCLDTEFITNKRDNYD